MGGSLEWRLLLFLYKSSSGAVSYEQFWHRSVDAKIEREVMTDREIG